MCKLLSEQVRSQYLSGCKYISMEVVALEHLKKLKPSTIPMEQFHSHLYDDSDNNTIQRSFKLTHI